MYKPFQTKQDKCLTDLRDIHPILFMLFGGVVGYCWTKGLPVVITRVIDGRIPNVSVSDTHEEGRAIDLSISGWAPEDIESFVNEMNKRYADTYGAISLKDNVARFAVFHVGTAAHIHLQVRKIL